MQIIVSDIGILIWAAVLWYSIATFGFLDVFKIYLVPYLWRVISPFVFPMSDVYSRR